MILHHRVPTDGVAQRHWAADLACGLALILCGCASEPTPRTLPVAGSVTVPEDWSATASTTAAGDASLVQWWQRFNDPILSLLVARTLHANTNIRSAYAALDQARALRAEAAAALWPALNASASARSDTVGGHSSGSSFQVGADAVWDLDIFGANRSALRASIATLEAGAASLGDVQVSMAAELGVSYILYRSVQARLAIASDNLASQQETLQITRWRQQAGLVTELETEQASAAAEQTHSLLPTLQISIDQTRHALAVLTGQPPAALDTLLGAHSPVPRTDDELNLSIPAEALRQRADVRAAEHQVTFALARVSQAKAARWPDFRLGGSLSLSATSVSSLSNGASALSALLASVSLPLFDGGARRAQVRAQRAALEQARVGYEAAVLNALKDVEDALVALSGDRERLLSLGVAATAATNAATLARQRYGSGLIDFETVLETQRTRLGTQDSVASATALVSTDQVRLYKALGGGWRDEGTRILRQ